MKSRRLRTTLFLTFVSFIFLFSCAATTLGLKSGAQQEPLARLQAQIDGILQDSVLQQTRVGIQVVEVNSGRVWYQRNARELFHPASNLKLLTTATALARLGADFRFKTQVLADSAALRDSVIQGTLYLKGYGNPDLTDDDLRWMVKELQRQGIRRIEGDLVCDASYFDSLYWGKGWMWDDTSSPDFAPISALAVNDNCVTVWVQPGKTPGDSLKVWMEPPTAYMRIENRGVSVDSTDSVQIRHFKVERKWVTPENTILVQGGMAVGSSPKRYRIEVLNAPLYVGTRFKEIAAELGVTITGTVREGTTPSHTRVLVKHHSPELTQVVYNINKISDNLSAEMLLKTLGAELKGVPGSAEKGTRVVREFLAEIGIDSTRYEMVDGSGVSRYNVVTPELMVKLLRWMYKHFPIQAEYQASLPIAGRDGTLKKRMLGTAAEGKLHAKTGTLRGVSTLSGYTETADGEILAFSIMMEHFVVRAKQIRQVQDRIGALLSNFKVASNKSQIANSK